MADAAHEWTDGRIAELERVFAKEYARAVKESKAKLKKMLAWFEAEREQREKALGDSKEALAKHRAWLEEQSVRLDRLDSLTHSLAERAMNANEIAVAAINDELPRIYSENANRSAYEVEKAVGRDLTFTLVDEDTVRRLIANGADGRLIPAPKLDRAKDYRWNRGKFTSAITQGILQGESIDDIAVRVASVFGMNNRTARRIARTATTGAENAGRVSSYERAESLGIEVKQEWLATLDERTRYSHRELDGEKVAVGEKFSNGCRYPGDPEGPASEVYNCRCTLIAAVGGFETDDGERWSRLPDDMTYEEWKTHKSMDVRQLESPRHPNRFFRRTGEMSQDEYLQYRRELSEVQHRAPIRLPKAEYAQVMSELNTHMNSEDRKHALVRKAIGNYYYTVVNKGFGDYVIIGRDRIE